jgi:hypothetical protein
MVNEDRALLLRLEREVARLRGELATFRSGLALGPDETTASVAGRIKRQLDDALTLGGQAMDNISVLYENTVISRNGMPWQPLAMPSGATGTADFRPASDGSLALRFRLTWRSAPGTVNVSGVPQDLWPSADWSDGPVSVAVNGMITLSVTGAQFSASVLVPTK